MYDAFAKSGIVLSTLGGAITGTVAEHALALLLALARNLHRQRDLQGAKLWQVACGVELAGLKLGLLGFGRIGRAIAVRARASCGVATLRHPLITRKSSLRSSCTCRTCSQFASVRRK